MPCEYETFFTNEDIFIAVLNLMMSISIITINSFILLVVFFNWKQIRIQCNNRASVILTINLSVADLVMGLLDIYFSLPLYLPELARYLGQHKLACIMRYAFIMLANIASGYTLVAIAVERYIYVVHALKYSELMNTRRTLLMISVVWTAAFLESSPLYFWNHWEENMCACDDTNLIPEEFTISFSITRIFVILIVVAAFHWRIHREALKIQSRKDSMSARSSLRTRSARVVLIICVVYILSWMPFSIMYFCKMSGIYIVPLIYKFCNCVIDISYVVNPFVYAYNNRAIGNAIVKTLKVLRPRSNYSFSDHRVSSNRVAMNHIHRRGTVFTIS
ncbi:adenosine receptor A3-like [Anabrus simplex]|uniref:adenosine receptor A3-like n=1 Tax=Anabrus simplex TaxID=316456 RepID=UPI0035A2E69D